MKKLSLIPFLMLCSFIQVNAQNYGSFASGVFLTKNGTLSGYRVTGDAVNQISPTPLSGDLGTFQRNSGSLILNGGETKTYKQNWANVCGTTLYYSVHPTGSTGSYSNINLPYKAGCNGSTFSDGLGNCGGNDQKWSTGASSVDLTNLCPGTYALDVYFSVPGSNNSTSDCGDNQYIGSASNPAASATFTIAPPQLTVTADTLICGSSYEEYSISTANGCPGGSISWSGGYQISDTSMLTFSEGTYTATCTYNGCQNTNSVSLTIVRHPRPAPPTVVSGPISCPAGTATVMANNYSGSILWSNGDTTASFTAPMGTYTATTTLDGCTSKTSDPAQVASCTPTCPQSNNLMTNGSFEDASISDEARGWRQIAQPGWHISGYAAGSGIETWKSGLLGVQAVDGAQLIELNAWELATVWQDVDVSPNVPMTLTWYHRAREATAPELVGVEVVDMATGQIIDTVLSSADTNWHQGSLTFIPPSSKLEVRFRSLNASGDGSDQTKGNIMDDISLNYVSCINQAMAKTGIMSKSGSISLSIAPNPVSDAAAIKLSGFENGEVSIQITNLNGSVISNTKAINVSGFDTRLDMSALRSGMYFVKVQQGGKVAVTKAIKK